jgi:hypothetical protein
MQRIAADARRSGAGKADPKAEARPEGGEKK